jgi:hypothetical protein
MFKNFWEELICLLSLHYLTICNNFEPLDTKDIMGYTETDRMSNSLLDMKITKLESSSIFVPTLSQNFAPSPYLKSFVKQNID